MRSEKEIKALILNFAAEDERVRAVLLNGSRADPDVPADLLQDFDVMFIVRDLQRFIQDHSWINIFGDRLLCQLPDEMTLDLEGETEEDITAFHYLMLFEDHNRIDLTLFSLKRFETDFEPDSLTIVWLDKDGIFQGNPVPGNKDYHVVPPGEKEFLDTCNEFWWVMTYVAKGLVREQITYAKEMLETKVRPMFMRMIEWNIGAEYGFSVSVGKAGKFVSRYVSKELYQGILKTYADADIENNWQSVFLMTEIFEKASRDLAHQLRFRYNAPEQQNVVLYLRQLYADSTISRHPEGGN